MCATTFMTQKQIMKRSGPVEGQAATVQQLMLYGMPAEPPRLRFLLPDRRAPLLGHQQPLDLRPAVLHPAQDAAARVAPPPRRRPPPRSRPSTQARSPRSRVRSRCARRPVARPRRSRRPPRRATAVDRRPHRGAGRCRRPAHRVAGRPRRSRPRSNPRPRRDRRAEGQAQTPLTAAPTSRRRPPRTDRPTDHRARPAARTDLGGTSVSAPQTPTDRPHRRRRGDVRRRAEPRPGTAG